MNRHSWISAVVGVGTILSMIVLIILLSWTKYLTAEDSSTEDLLEDSSPPSDDEVVEELSSNNDGLETRERESISRYIRDNNIEAEAADYSFLSNVIPAILNSSATILLILFGSVVTYSVYHGSADAPSKIIENTKWTVEDFMTAEETQKVLETLQMMIVNAFNAVIAWDDIFVKLLVVKVVFAILLIIVYRLVRI